MSWDLKKKITRKQKSSRSKFQTKGEYRQNNQGSDMPRIYLMTMTVQYDGRGGVHSGKDHIGNVENNGWEKIVKYLRHCAN